MNNAIKFVMMSVTIASFSLAGCKFPAAQMKSGKIEPGNGQIQSLLFLTMDISPDGKMMVFSGTGNGGTHLYLLNLMTHKVTQLTSTAGSDNYPAFSPDGKTIVYQSAAAANQSRHLFLISVSGKQKQQLTNTPATDDESPHFSPNGEEIVFSRAEQFHAKDARESTSNGYDVWVVSRNGSRLSQVTHLNSGGVMRPRFYPDNRHVLFEKTTTDGSPFLLAFSSLMHIAKADTQGHEPVQDVVNFGNMDSSSPYFYPDGKQIVFCGNFNGTLDLYRMSLAGGKPSPILPGQSNTGFCNPIVTSDGKSLYCLERYTPDLYQMNIDGSGMHEIADSSLFSDPMHWKPH